MTIGPDRALYVAEGVAGRISRIDPDTGHVTTFASGLPKRLTGFPVGQVVGMMNEVRPVRDVMQQLVEEYIDAS